MNHGCPAEALLEISSALSPDTFIIHCHPCLLRLTPSLHPSITCIHPSPSFRLVPGLSSCTCHYFPVCSGLMFFVFVLFSLWFCIVSLSLVSRQWFYPMVGDIMLFYHRVEPRTGCWRVSASIRQSIPPPFINPKVEGVRGVLDSGDGACGVTAGGPSISLTCICLSVLFIFFLPCVHIVHCMCCQIICASKVG